MLSWLYKFTRKILYFAVDTNCIEHRGDSIQKRHWNGSQASSSRKFTVTLQTLSSVSSKQIPRFSYIGKKKVPADFRTFRKHAFIAVFLLCGTFLKLSGGEEVSFPYIRLLVLH